VTYCCNENLETVSSSTDYSKIAIPAANLLSRPHFGRFCVFMRMVLALLNRLGLSEIGPRTIWLWAMFMRLQWPLHGKDAMGICAMSIQFVIVSLVPGCPYFGPICTIALSIA
jgi:hypothetical protein